MHGDLNFNFKYEKEWSPNIPYFSFLYFYTEKKSWTGSKF